MALARANAACHGAEAQARGALTNRAALAIQQRRSMGGLCDADSVRARERWAVGSRTGSLLESLALAGTASLGREQPEACLVSAQRQGARGVEGHGFAGQPLRLARALAHLHAGGGLVGRRRSAGRNRALEKLRERAIKLKIGYWVEQIGMQIDVVRGFTAFKAGRADVGIAALRLAAPRGVQAVPPKDSKDGRPGLCDRHSGQACGRRHASWGRSLQ